MESEKALIIIVFLSLIGLAASQPNLPHRVYGEVSQFETGSLVTGANITFRNSSGNILATQNTTDNGFYDLNVELKDSGQRFFLFVEGVNTSESLSFSRGKSEALDCRLNSSSSCVENQDTDDTDQEEDNQSQDQNQDQNDEQNSDDQGSGGESGGSGGGGGSSPGGFGSTEQNEEQNKPPEDKNISVSLQLDNGSSATARIQNLSQGQDVDINTQGTSLVRGLNFVSGQESSKSIISVNSSFVSLDDNNFTILETIDIETKNITSSETASLGLEVDESFSSGNEITAEDFALLKGQESLNKVELSVVVGLQRYLYEANIDSIDGSYQFGYFNKSSSKQRITVKNLSTSSSEGNTVLSIRVKNSAENELVDSVRLIKNKSTLKQWKIKLKPNQDKILNYSVSLDKGSHFFSVRDYRAEIDVSSNEAPSVLLVIGSLVSIIGLLIFYLYLSGYRRASQLDETIEKLEKKGVRANKEMKSLRDDLRRIRMRAKSSRGKTNRNS